MKLITKPIKNGTMNELKGSSKAMALGTILLSGVMAVASTGCTAEIKAPDGTPIGSVVINGDEALASGIMDYVESADGITVPTDISSQDQMLPLINGVISDEETADSLEADVRESESGTRETVAPQTADTTPAPVVNTTTPAPETKTDKADNTNNTNNTNNSSKTDFSKLSNGTVLHFTANDKGTEFKVSGDFGTSILFFRGNDLVYSTDGNVQYLSSISSTRAAEAFLIRENGTTYIYINVVRGNNNNEVNIYEVTDTSFRRIAVVTDFIVSPSINNTKFFKGYDGGGSAGIFCSERMFKVGKDGIPVPADNISFLGSAPVVAAKDLTGYLVVNGSKSDKQKTIKAGEKVTLGNLNEVEYIDLKDKDGNVIRVDFTDACCTYYDQKDYRWIYKAVGSMVVAANNFKKSVDYMDEGVIIQFDDAGDDFWTDGSFGSFNVECKESSKIRITKDTKTYDLDVRADGAGIALSRVYMLKSSGKVYIYVNTVRQSNYASDLNVYEVTDDSITYNGTVENLLIRIMNDTKSFLCYEDYGNNEPFLITRNYKVWKNGLPIPADNYSEMEYSQTFRAARDMEGKIVRDGKATDETVTIKCDDLITPVAVNEVEYIDFKDASGNIIRVDFTNECCTYYDQNDYRWIRPAILSMVKAV